MTLRAKKKTNPTGIPIVRGGTSLGIFRLRREEFGLREKKKNRVFFFFNRNYIFKRANENNRF